MMAAACCLVELCDEASDQRGDLAGLAHRRPELANHMVALNDGGAHANAGYALGLVLATDVVEQLIAADDRLVRGVLDVDRVVGEQVGEARVVPGLPSLTVTLDKETVTLDVPEKLRAENLQFDRFGLFSPGVGGSKVKIYFDDLEYTAK